MHYCVILNADGWTDEEIAAALGISLEDVTRCLYPIDDSVWDGLMKEIWKKRLTAESDYRAEVQEALTTLRATSYEGAYHCAMIQGREHLVPELKHWQRRYEQEALHWKDKGFGSRCDYRKCDQSSIVAIQLTAWDAARLALGIPDKSEFKSLWVGERFLEYHKILEALTNRRRLEYNEETGKFVWVKIQEAVAG